MHITYSIAWKPKVFRNQRVRAYVVSTWRTDCRVALSHAFVAFWAQIGCGNSSWITLYIIMYIYVVYNNIQCIYIYIYINIDSWCPVLSIKSGVVPKRRRTSRTNSFQLSKQNSKPMNFRHGGYVGHVLRFSIRDRSQIGRSAGAKDSPLARARYARWKPEDLSTHAGWVVVGKLGWEMLGDTLSGGSWDEQLTLLVFLVFFAIHLRA